MRKINAFLCAILIVGMASQTLLVGEDKVLADPPRIAVVEATPKAYPSLPAFLLQGTSRIRAYENESKGVGFGSAFAVDLSEFGLMGKNYVMTAAHVIVDDEKNLQKNLEVEINIDATTRVWVPAKMIAMDVEKDLAILAVEMDVTGHAKIAKTDVMSIGDMIAIVGCPSGTLPSVTFGYLCGKSFEIYGRREGGDLWQGSAAIYPGNSGGPVFNPNTGEIIGIAVAGINQHGFAANVDFFVPLHIMRNLIEINLKKFEKYEKK